MPDHLLNLFNNDQFIVLLALSDIELRVTMLHDCTHHNSLGRDSDKPLTVLLKFTYLWVSLYCSVHNHLVLMKENEL